MKREHIAVVLEGAQLTLDDIVVSCTVSREWIIEHVQAGVLLDEPGPDPGLWAFTGRDLRRARRMIELERTFDANPELAGLVADMLEEIEYLRGRVPREGR